MFFASLYATRKFTIGEIEIPTVEYLISELSDYVQAVNAEKDKIYLGTQCRPYIHSHGNNFRWGISLHGQWEHEGELLTLNRKIEIEGDYFSSIRYHNGEETSSIVDSILKNSNCKVGFGIMFTDFNRIYREVCLFLEKLLPTSLECSPELIHCRLGRHFCAEFEDGLCQECFELNATKMELRKNEAATLEAVSLFETALLERNLKKEVRFEREDSHISVDFFCSDSKICIEIDGREHFNPAKGTADRKRDRWLFRTHNITTLRFSNSEITEDYQGCLDEIDRVRGKLDQ